MKQQIGRSENPINKKMRDEFIEEMYNAAVLYYNFLPSDKDKIEIDNVYMISKEFVDYFKDKINYDKNINLFKVKNDDNQEKFYESFNNYLVNDLEAIVFHQITIYADLNDLEVDINNGFEFVSQDFLVSLEVDIDFDDYKVKYIKDENNIIIVFADESKLIICNDEKGAKYHAIPAPVISIKSIGKKTLKRRNTICITGRRDKTVIIPRSVNE